MAAAHLEVAATAVETEGVLAVELAEATLEVVMVVAVAEGVAMGEGLEED